MIETLPQSEPVLLPQRPSGRPARSVLGYSLLTALMIVTPMPVFVPAALIHCAIRHGRRVGWAVLTVTVLLVIAYGASTQAKTPDLQYMTWASLAAVVLTAAIPAMAAVPMVARAESFGRVLMFLMAGALVGLALTEVASQALLSFSPFAAQVAQTKEMWNEVARMYRELKAPAEMIRVAERAGPVNAYLLPGQILASLSVIYILSLLMYGRLRAWQSVEAARPYLFRNFALPEWLLFAFVFGGLTPLAGGLLQKIAANTLVVVVFLYILQGLAVFRAMLLSMGVGPVGSLLAWMLIGFMFFTGMSQLLLGVVGLFDPFFDFRHFKKRKDDSHESHSD
ncbi:MAG TPA: DUF2232 domain-containing protein [Thermoanaerobaculia bacterium]|nr:DUF2232 domain-containing protein [Thermoanaerobaculia bacterium]